MYCIDSNLFSEEYGGVIQTSVAKKECMILEKQETLNSC